MKRLLLPLAIVPILLLIACGKLLPSPAPDDYDPNAGCQIQQVGAKATRSSHSYDYVLAQCAGYGNVHVTGTYDLNTNAVTEDLTVAERGTLHESGICSVDPWIYGAGPPGVLLPVLSITCSRSQF